MVYPACLVLVAQSDIPALAASNSSGTSSGAHHSHTNLREPAFSSVNLTPPTSPEDALKGTAVYTVGKLIRSFFLFDSSLK